MRVRACMSTTPSTPTTRTRSQLGNGTSGTTHRMRSKLDGDLYAVKMMKVKQAGVTLESLSDEAARLAMLHHAHIVRYYTACSFKKGKTFAIVTELLEGSLYAERVRAGAAAPEVSRWVGEIASALTHMHGLRMQHRDVKPDNVLFDSAGHAKLIDVGLACTLSSKSRVSTKAGGAVGTNLYMSPEKGSGHSYDAKDDVWALGCLLVGGVLGKPLEDMDLNTVGIFALNRPGVEKLIREACRASAHLGQLVQVLLSKDPARRPTAAKVAEKLLPPESKPPSADLLAPPSSWAPMADPLTALLVEIGNGPERSEAVRRFRLTLPHNVRVHSVERVQNLPLWQSYVVKRQSVFMREPATASTAAARFERAFLFHGTDESTVPKIVHQGFNRSFCGKNATAFGKGVYFARDASYSMSSSYSKPDVHGVQRMFLARVCIGDYCKGERDALTPAVRHGNVLYDTTVDNMADPSIYVAYNDAQAYPEYLIKFSQ